MKFKVIYLTIILVTICEINANYIFYKLFNQMFLTNSNNMLTKDEFKKFVVGVFHEHNFTLTSKLENQIDLWINSFSGSIPIEQLFRYSEGNMIESIKRDMLRVLDSHDIEL